MHYDLWLKEGLCGKFWLHIIGLNVDLVVDDYVSYCNRIRSAIEKGLAHF